jgi:Family of unknown function (DUF6298)
MSTLRLVAAWFVVATLAGTASADYLELLPSNKHYLVTHTGGVPVQLTGYHSITPGEAGWDTNIDYLGAKHVKYARVWQLGRPTDMNGVADFWPWPAVATLANSCGVAAPRTIYDLSQWNAFYWNRLKAALARAKANGIYAEIILFDGSALWDKPSWSWSPWARDNHVNVNNVNPTPNLPTACNQSQQPNDASRNFYDAYPDVRAVQRAYVRKMIAETIQFDNVVYEVENEHRTPWDITGPVDPGWAREWTQFIRTEIASQEAAGNGTGPRLVSFSMVAGAVDQSYALDDFIKTNDPNNPDIANRHFPKGFQSLSSLNGYIENRWGYNKAINIDEFANNAGTPGSPNPDATGLRQMAWTITMSGGHFHIEDVDPATGPEAIASNIEDFKAQSGWDLGGASPNRAIVQGGMQGYCMQQPAVEYVCYVPSPSGASVVLNLAGNPYGYVAMFWNPRTGGFANFTRITLPQGGNFNFGNPGAGDWVLFVSAQTRYFPWPQVGPKASASSCLNNNCGDATWGINNVRDFSAATAWSSAYHSSPAAGEQVWVYTDRVRAVNFLLLYPRVYQNQSLCVPEYVNVYYWSRAIANWVYVKSENLPANMSPNGYALYLPSTVQSDTFLISTDRLRTDGAGGYYFQLAELVPGFFR